MKELELKYGCNPNQKPARILMQQGELPLEGFADAFAAWADGVRRGWENSRG